MRISSIQWTNERSEHIARHNITPEELEEAVFNDSHGKTFMLETSKRDKEEKLYAYLVVQKMVDISSSFSFIRVRVLHFL